VNSPHAIIKKTKVFFKNACLLVLRTGVKIKSRVWSNNNSNSNGQNQIDLDKKLVYSLSKSRIPNLTQLKYIKRYLSKKEVILLYISFLIILVSLSFSGIKFYIDHLQIVPDVGGKYTEGAIGVPKHINPLYASINDVDNDISQLVYSSLFKRGKNNELINDLVENYEISENNLEYTFTIKDNVYWHTGEKLTVDDIIFTFNILKDKQYKSPLRVSFIGVDTEKIENRKFKFILSAPYAAFLDLLTFGILPAQVWHQIPPESAILTERNLKPVGSGPYKLDTFTKDAEGNIKEYNLVRNEDYYGQVPYINISYKFFLGFEEAIAALNDNLVDGVSYLPQELNENIITPLTYNFHQMLLPQLTIVFFNPKNNPILENKKLRTALAQAINREEIINRELNGSAHSVDSPILPNSFAYNQEIEGLAFSPEEAIQALEDLGWKQVSISEEDIENISNNTGETNESSGEESDVGAIHESPNENESSENDSPEGKEISEEDQKKLTMSAGNWRMKGDEYLVIKLTTGDTVENQKIVEAIKKYWETIGVKTELEILPAGEMQSGIIKERNFEALFYGQVVGADPDPYAFWHSSQTGEDGFNIANFANKEADQLLEDARITSDINERIAKYKEFQNIVTKEIPVIFMYSPTYTYVQDKKIKGFDVASILSPRDRFTNVGEWYIKTKKKLIW
jgi:peptide/nickel transport system substrate-binding protein